MTTSTGDVPLARTAAGSACGLSSNPTARVFSDLVVIGDLQGRAHARGSPPGGPSDCRYTLLVEFVRDGLQGLTDIPPGLDAKAQGRVDQGWATQPHTRRALFATSVMATAINRSPETLRRLIREGIVPEATYFAPGHGRFGRKRLWTREQVLATAAVFEGGTQPGVQLAEGGVAR